VSLRIDQRVKGWPSFAGRVVAVAATNSSWSGLSRRGTASRPLRVQTGQTDLVEPMEGLSSSRRYCLNVPCPLTPGNPSRLHIQDLHRFHGLHREPRGSALPQYLATRQASLNRYGPLICFPHRGFRHWAPTRPVSRPSRQPATGPPDSYPDRTHTGKQRRASDQDTTAGRSPLNHWTHRL
jgi:hypothetical protein